MQKTVLHIIPSSDMESDPYLNQIDMHVNQKAIVEKGQGLGNINAEHLASCLD